MFSTVLGVTGQGVEYALDGIALRHTAIASNIANARVEGYSPKRVSFEAAVRAVFDADGSNAPSLQLSPPVTYEEAPIDGEGGLAFMNQEITALNGNVIQYQSLISGIEKYKAMISYAISEGRR